MTDFLLHPFGTNPDGSFLFAWAALLAGALVIALCAVVAALFGICALFRVSCRCCVAFWRGLTGRPQPCEESR